MIKAEDVSVEIDGKGYQVLIEYAAICTSLIDVGFRPEKLKECVDIAVKAVKEKHAKEGIVTDREFMDFLYELRGMIKAAKEKRDAEKD